MKEYQVRYCFNVSAKDRFDAVRKVEEFLPETNDAVSMFFVIATKPVTCNENCAGCDEYDDWGCVYQFVNEGECKREPLSSGLAG